MGVVMGMSQWTDSLVMHVHLSRHLFSRWCIGGRFTDCRSFAKAV